MVITIKFIFFQIIFMPISLKILQLSIPDQINKKMTHSKMVTAKRLGFGFKTDDV